MRGQRNDLRLLPFDFREQSRQRYADLGNGKRINFASFVQISNGGKTR